MDRFRFARQLKRIKVRVQSAADTLAGARMIAEDLPDSLFRVTLLKDMEMLDSRIGKLWSAISNQLIELEEKQENGQA